MPPNRSAAAAYIACTDASSATSTCTASASRTCAATASAASRFDVGDADLRALLREEHGRVGAHAAAGARDHADLSVETSHYSSVA